MTLEQWIQFVLLERLQAIISARGPFPQKGSMPFMRCVLGADTDTNRLQNPLAQLDDLVNRYA